MFVVLKQTRCLRHSRTGAVAVELALSAPLILVFAIGVADFGRVAHFHQVVCNAARTAAESGATHGCTPSTYASWESELRAAALDEMQNIPDFDETDLNCAVSTSTDDDGLAIITVSISYPFRTCIAWPGIPSQVLLSKAVQFRQFR